ncbi:unnamed protein product [Peniophora sp. CBMAI 1063]|nr:unnamed protein product [Peniophora sp. CBMAI 1063]
MDPALPQPVDFATSPVDPAWQLAFTDATVCYAQELFASRMAVPGAPAPRASEVLELDFWLEIQHLISLYMRAHRNKYTLPWSCEAYNAYVGGQDGTKTAFEDALSGHFPPLESDVEGETEGVVETRPSLVVDKYGVIVLACLPGVIGHSIQADAFHSTQLLNPTFEVNGPDSSPTWRLEGQAYRRDVESLYLSPGLATLGFWHSTGHKASSKP